MFATVVMVSNQESLIETAKRMLSGIIVLDMTLPTQAQGNVVKRIVREAPPSTIVVLSVDNDRILINEILNSDAHAIVLKCSAGTDLISAIEHALGGKTYDSPLLSIP